MCAFFERIKAYLMAFFARPATRKFFKNFGAFCLSLLAVCVAFVLIVGLVAFGIWRYVFSDYKPNETPVKIENIEISDKAPETKIYHIAAFGIDDEEVVGRADTIMVFSVDKEHSQLKLTSIMRDSLVPMKGHNEDKINHAYAYGGAELMLATINQNFSMDIKEYVALSFEDFIAIIDMLGGVDLDLSPLECKKVNEGAPYEEHMLPETGGMMHLNGKQAIAYVRIRKIDNEQERTARQRRLIQQLAYKLKEQHLTDYPALLKQMLPLVETSLDEGELLKIAIDVLGCDTQLKQYVLPDDGDNAWGGIYNGYWCWRYDIPAATERWHSFLENKV